MENKKAGNYGQNSNRRKRNSDRREESRFEKREPAPQKPATVHVLDYLPHGSESDKRPIHARQPLIQAIDEKQLTLVEINHKEGEMPPMLGTVLQTGGESGIRIKRRISYDELSRGAKLELPILIQEIIKNDSKRFIEIFNNPQVISPRLNSLNLIPGIGEKLMWEIIEAGKVKKFENIEDLEKRVPTLYGTEQKIIDRIILEIKGKEKYYLLAAEPRKKSGFESTQRRR